MKHYHDHDQHLLDTLLSRIGGKQKRNRNGYLVQCPLHDDNNPSLSLGISPETGRLLAKCFVCGDVFNELLERYNLKPETYLVEIGTPRTDGADNNSTANGSNETETETRVGVPISLELYAHSKGLPVQFLRECGVDDSEYRDKQRGAIPVVVFPYRDERNGLVCTRYRIALTGDRFRHETGKELSLYGLWREQSDDVLFLVEGETDALTLWHAGFPAYGIPGANAWKPEWIHHLQMFRKVVVIPDNDSAGKQLVEKLWNSAIGDTRMQDKLLVARLRDCKDVNELWLAVGCDVQQFRKRLNELLESAKPASAIIYPEFKLVSVKDVERTIAEPIVPNFLYRESITILAGEAGVGKTTFAMEIVDALIRGSSSLWNGGVSLDGKPLRVLWLDFDQSRSQILDKMESAYGDLPDDVQFGFLPESLMEPLTDEGVAKLRSVIRTEGIQLLVVDTLLDWLAVDDANDDTQAREGIQRIRRVIHGTGCSVLAIHHTRKSGAGANIRSTQSLAGSHRFAAKVDVVGVLFRVERDDDEYAKLMVLKDRFGSRFEMLFKPYAHRFIPASGERAPRSEWTVVRDYLRAKQDWATYEELMKVLKENGYTLASEKALRRRVDRWCEKGWITRTRKGFPPQTLVRLTEAYPVIGNPTNQPAPANDDELAGDNDAQLPLSKNGEGAKGAKGAKGANGAIGDEQPAKGEHAPDYDDDGLDGLSANGKHTQCHNLGVNGTKGAIDDDVLMADDSSFAGGSDTPIAPFAPFAPFAPLDFGAGQMGAIDDGAKEKEDGSTVCGDDSNHSAHSAHSASGLNGGLDDGRNGDGGDSDSRDDRAGVGVVELETTTGTVEVDEMMDLAEVLTVGSELLELAAELGYPQMVVDVGDSRYHIPPTEQAWRAVIRAVVRDGQAHILHALLEMDDTQRKVYDLASRLSFPTVLEYDAQSWIVDEQTPECWISAILDKRCYEYLSELADNDVILFTSDLPANRKQVVDKRELAKLFTECGFPRIWIYSHNRNLLLVSRDPKRIELFVRHGYGYWLSEKLRYRERINTPYIRGLERKIAELTGTPFTGSTIADWLDHSPDWYLYQSTVRNLREVLDGLREQQVLVPQAVAVQRDSLFVGD